MSLGSKGRHYRTILFHNDLPRPFSTVERSRGKGRRGRGEGGEASETLWRFELMKIKWRSLALESPRARSSPLPPAIPVRRYNPVGRSSRLVDVHYATRDDGSAERRVPGRFQRVTARLLSVRGTTLARTDISHIRARARARGGERRVRKCRKKG